MEWTQWAPFTPSTINRAPLYQGVYEIALDGSRYQHALGWSGTIYIGEAHADDSSIRARARLSAHFNGNGNQKIYSLLRKGCQIKVRWSTLRDYHCRNLLLLQPRPTELYSSYSSTSTSSVNGKFKAELRTGLRKYVVPRAYFRDRKKASLTVVTMHRTPSSPLIGHDGTVAAAG
jgi:hypothetical protein